MRCGTGRYFEGKLHKSKRVHLPFDFGSCVREGSACSGILFLKNLLLNLHVIIIDTQKKNIFGPPDFLLCHRRTKQRFLCEIYPQYV